MHQMIFLKNEKKKEEKEKTMALLLSLYMKIEEQNNVKMEAEASIYKKQEMI
jgi:hypothetical protein